MAKLSARFIEKMKELLGEEELSRYLSCFEEDRLYGLRVNTSKLSPEQFRAMASYELEPVPWASNGFYYSGEERPSRDPWYYAGLYYLQEPSAMAPAALLPIEPGDNVLDLCAAPGGKSTELGIRLKGKGFLLSNDISNTRAKALLKNLELWGIQNICVTSEEPKKLSGLLPEFFDKILIDAPCSGEGMFRKDPDMVKSYEERGPEYYAVIQQEITEQAVSMLKPGGFLLYSTCTFSRCEDEEIIERLLDHHPELRLEKLSLVEGASDGIGLSGCMRFFPHKIKGEGHFMALLKKAETVETAFEPNRERNQNFLISKAGQQEEKLPEELVTFLDRLTWKVDPSRILIKNEQVYYLPEGFSRQLKLRYLRTGLLLGELKKGRFEPGQPLAMALKPEEFDTVFSLSRQDERVLRYLKGETLMLKEEEAPIKGWCLVCMDGFPLGFAKGAGRNLKNKYYPGWRWQ